MKKIILTLVVSMMFLTSLYPVSANDENSIGEASVTGITDGEEYEDDITVFTNDSEVILLDGVEIPEGYIINEIGHHTLELVNGGIVEKTINFTILPRFEKLVDGGVYGDRLELKLANIGTLTLDGTEVENGETIVKIGHHYLTVEGVNGYSKEYAFTIESFKLELVKDTEYTLPVFLDVSDYKTLYVNGVRLRGDETLREYGYYDVEITGTAGYHKTFHFTIVPNFGNLIDGGTYEKFIKINQASASKLYIDNVEVTGAKHLSQIGNHTIRYEGINGYVKIYNISVAEENLDIDGKTFESFKLKYKGMELFLNDQVYVSESVVDTIGYYTVTVKGVNGYVNQYSIFIHSATKGLDIDERTTEAFNINTKYNKVYVNGSIVPDGYRITETGDYEVVLWGEGGYTESYNFEYINPHTQQAIDFTFFVGGFGVMTLLTYGVVMVRRFKK